MNIQQALAQVVERNDLSFDDMQAVMRQIMTGECTPAQIGGFLIALRMKGETVDEITAAVAVMRELSVKVDLGNNDLVDTCGTGGDGANLFNISTASTFVVAAAGGKVAKHGNRGASSSTGSADVLEAAGVELNLTAEQVTRCVEELGVGFMFAQNHHSAMKHAIGPRKEMKTRTIFNMLGPMTNPAGAKKQVIGVFSKEIMPTFAQVLNKLGSQHVLVLHSDEGLDEISLAGNTSVVELNKGKISEYRINPSDFGIDVQSLDGLQVANAQESLALIQGAFDNSQGAAFDKARDIIALNAGAAIYAADIASSLAQGISMAQDAIYSGLAGEKLTDLASFTRVFSA